MVKVALLGTGLLGTAIAQRLLSKRISLTVYNRTRSKVKLFEGTKAKIAHSPGEAVAGADCILLLLADQKAINSVLFSSFNKSLKGKTIIQMGTIGPEESRLLEKKVKGAGGGYLECPVLGSRSEALAGSLILMVGSSVKNFAKWKGFLRNIGGEPKYAGAVGKAAALKLAVNQLIASHAASFSLSLRIVQKNNIDTDLFMSIVRQSSLYAPMFDKKLPNWLKRNYKNANFSTKHLLKDVNLIIKEAGSKEIAIDVIRSIKKVLLRTIDRGYGNKDYSSLYEGMER